MNTNSCESRPQNHAKFDRKSELKAFDESKTGVKGLIEAGVSKIPKIFIHDQDKLDDYRSASGDSNLSIPVINLEGINDDSARKYVVEEVRDACKNWGFFQVINHGISSNTLDEMISGVRRFHDQDPELRMKFYAREESSNKLMYNTNFDLYQASVANWRDSIYCCVAPNPPNPEDLPQVCSDIMLEYSDKVRRLGFTLMELLSEALGLNPNHLREIGCAEELFFVGHYYPACPEPDLTMGLTKHTDSAFITLLLQDQIGGLQTLHENQWTDVKPVPGALIVNLGDMMQLMTNGEFKSVYHKVVAQKVGPRISVAIVFRNMSQTLYGPIKELLSEENPPLYKQTSLKDYVSYVLLKGLDGKPGLDHFML
ncbi:1-aminocyclopropane-1-carboxylate oxidase homolog 1-like [Humulus lupulus]|uniref:1-aminocyclopropane-1-carboxylate oxidase homolog 1-like n=1 Tax=Humulus lupulus TaxID=3486 RepID=UPI002B40F13E|nr:1-aminocyclopropane-1-carboxylate oxidase homolog 1-like [Humulus lupulus]